MCRTEEDTVRSDKKRRKIDDAAGCIDFEQLRLLSANTLDKPKKKRHNHMLGLMMRSVFSLALAMALLAVPAMHSAAGTQPYRILRSAHIFSFGGVGIAGVRTPEEKAYDVLIGAPDAEQQLRRLLVEATTLEGKMYALYGLRQLRVRDYWHLAMPYRRGHGSINTAFGCIVGHEDVSETVVYADHARAK